MKMNRLIWGIWLTVLLGGCYKEQHFSLPGPYDTEGLTASDTLPNPFGRTHTSGYWLIKDNVVDYSQIACMGYTDFHPEVDGTSLSWYDNGEGLSSRQHYNPDALDNSAHFNGDNLAYQTNELYSRGFLECGAGKKWYVYARVSADYMYDNLRFDYTFYVGDNGWKNRGVFFSNQYDAGIPAYTWAIGNIAPISILKGNYHWAQDYWAPDNTFEIECIYNNGTMMFGFNNTWMFTYAPTVEEVSFPFIFRPWKNAIRFHDLYIEGDYRPANDIVAYRNEAGYTAIQRPALAKKEGEILLFAEGRKYNVVQTSNLKSKRSNATDIIVKRSSDNGTTFGEPEIIVGGDESVNMSPCTVTSSDGMLYLFYTVSPQSVQLGKDNEIYYRSSADGKNWSEPVKVDITVPEYASYQVETVNGHGTCLENGNMAVAIKYTLGRNQKIAVLMGNGTEWSIKGMLDGSRNTSCELWSEGNILYCMLASSENTGNRLIASSTDGGSTWSKPENKGAAIGTAGCSLDGATVSMPDGTWVHFSPTGQSKSSAFRPDVLPATWETEISSQKIIYISAGPDLTSGLITTRTGNRGDEWTGQTPILTQKTFSDYVYYVGNMDALVLDGHTVLCVYEGGTKVPYEGLKYHKMTIQ